MYQRKIPKAEIFKDAANFSYIIVNLDFWEYLSNPAGSYNFYNYDYILQLENSAENKSTNNYQKNTSKLSNS